MAIGPAPFGFLYFTGVKFLGYTTYSNVLNHAISRRVRNLPGIWKSGLIRTGIGVGVGIVVGIGFFAIAHLIPLVDRNAISLFFVLLVPIRIGEWWYFLWLRYRNCGLRGNRKAIAIILGIATSFLLDFMGVILMLVAPGGAWVC